MKYLRHINESEEPLLYRSSTMRATYDLIDDNSVDIKDVNYHAIDDFISQYKSYPYRCRIEKSNYVNTGVNMVNLTTIDKNFYIYQLKDEYFAVIGAKYYICDEIEGVLQLLKVIM
jgi:hypothetical protein